ncbi:MAG: heme exporter protein CcmD [Parvibaculaceae bacterium]|nr:heme exporter protein CcmD [Parvibaculaceae bacterium]
MAEFFHMGGYAAYVWTCYGLAAAVVAALVWQSLSDWRRQSSLADKLEKAAGGRVRRAAAPAREDDR